MPAVSPIHENMVLFLGTITHAMFEQENENYRSELKLEALDVVGRADIIYNNGTVIDLKTTRWMKTANLPYGSHEIQVNIYAQLMREMGLEVKDLYIQYIDLSGPTKCRKCKLTYTRTEQRQGRVPQVPQQHQGRPPGDVQVPHHPVARDQRQGLHH